jgi:hypothetical protein
MNTPWFWFLDFPKKMATCKSKCSACGGQRCLDSGQGTHVAKLKTGRKLGAGDPQSTDRGGGGGV